VSRSSLLNLNWRAKSHALPWVKCEEESRCCSITPLPQSSAVAVNQVKRKVLEKNVKAVVTLIELNDEELKAVSGSTGGRGAWFFSSNTVIGTFP
jgi:hypothetical protein